MLSYLIYSNKNISYFFNREGGRQGAKHKCKTCNGRGVKVTLRQLGPGMVQQMQSICPDCHGEGTEHLLLYIIVRCVNGGV